MCVKIPTNMSPVTGMPIILIYDYSALYDKISQISSTYLNKKGKLLIPTYLTIKQLTYAHSTHI